MMEVSPVDRKAAHRLLADVLRGLAPYPPTDDDEYLSMADPAAVDAFSARLNLPEIPAWLAPLSEVCRRTGLDGEQVGHLLAAPLKESGVRLLSLKGDALTNYIMAMIPALFALADYIPDTDKDLDRLLWNSFGHWSRLVASVVDRGDINEVDELRGHLAECREIVEHLEKKTNSADVQDRLQSELDGIYADALIHESKQEENDG